MERRHSTRIPYKASAVVLQDGTPVPSEVLDISKFGMFINTPGRHNQGEKTLVSIILKGGNTTLSVTLPCAVARVSDSGIGCTSPHLEPETFLFMSNLIHSQKVAPSQFMQSLYTYMDGLDLLGR